MELQLSLTAAERDSLVSLLETTLKEIRVEEHRTRTPSYRASVIEREKLLESVLNKLRQAK